MTPNAQKPTSGNAGITIASNSSAVGGGLAHNGHAVGEREIQLRAYRKWESAGKPEGDGVQFWLEAEQEMKKQK